MAVTETYRKNKTTVWSNCTHLGGAYGPTYLIVTRCQSIDYLKLNPIIYGLFVKYATVNEMYF